MVYSAARHGVMRRPGSHTSTSIFEVWIRSTYLPQLQLKNLGQMNRVNKPEPIVGGQITLRLSRMRLIE